MQTIWSRAAQSTCSCRCPSCLFTKAATARRQVTTARRLLMRPLQSATFTYSAIFASACLIDGKLKTDRRRELDQSLLEAREALEKRAIKDESISELRTPLPRDRAHNFETVEEGSTISTQASTIADIENEIVWDELKSCGVGGQEGSDIHETLGPRLDRRKFPPQSLWATSESKEKAGSGQISERKLRMHELAVARLTLELLLNAGLYSDAGFTDREFPGRLSDLLPLSRMQMTKKIQQLKLMIHTLKAVPASSFDRAYSKYGLFLEQNRWMPYYKARTKGVKDLNHSMRQEFAQALEHPHTDRKDTILRICSALVGDASTAAPPNFVTWNILLKGFTDLDRHEMVGRVFAALTAAKARPNELTCTLVLNHFNKIGDANSFTSFVDLMRGIGPGVMLAKPDLVVTRENDARIVLKEHARQRKVVQKVAPTPMVYNALVSGLLRFFGPDFTFAFCKELESDGWTSNKQALGQLLHSYVGRQDWEGGLKVWAQIQDLVSQSGVSGAQYDIKSIDYKLGATILQLCLVKHKQKAFNEVFDSALGAGFDGRLLMDAVHDTQHQISNLNEPLPNFRGFRKVLAQFSPRQSLDQFRTLIGSGTSRSAEDSLPTYEVESLSKIGDETSKGYPPRLQLGAEAIGGQNTTANVSSDHHISSSLVYDNDLDSTQLSSGDGRSFQKPIPRRDPRKTATTKLFESLAEVNHPVAFNNGASCRSISADDYERTDERTLFHFA